MAFFGAPTLPPIGISSPFAPIQSLAVGGSRLPAGSSFASPIVASSLSTLITRISPPASGSWSSDVGMSRESLPLSAPSDALLYLYGGFPSLTSMPSPIDIDIQQPSMGEIVTIRDGALVSEGGTATNGALRTNGTLGMAAFAEQASQWPWWLWLIIGVMAGWLILGNDSQRR